MKNTPALTIVCLTLSAMCATAQQVVYQADTSIAPSYSWDSTVGGSGSFDVVYNRTSGTEGPLSFVKTFHFSNMSGSGDLWLESAKNYGKAGMEPELSSLYANLPTSNQTSLSSVGLSRTRDIALAGINSGKIQWLGQFSVYSDPLPTLAGLTLSDEYAQFSSQNNYLWVSGRTDTPRGYYAEALGGTFIDYANPYVSEGATNQYSHSDTVVWNYTAWSEDGQITGQNNRSMLALTAAQVTYSLVPEPSGVALLGFGFVWACLVRRRK